MTISISLPSRRNYAAGLLVRDCTLFIGLWVVLSFIGLRMSYAGIALGLPLRDDWFDAADSALRFPWWSMCQYVSSHPDLHLAMEYVYLSHPAQALASVWLLAIQARHRNSELFGEFLVATVLAIIIGTLVPALGPSFAHGIMTPTEDAMMILRAGGHPAPTFGVISFPSLHTVMGILFIRAHRGLRTAAPFLLLNLAMLATVPVCGNHYLADMLGGAGITWIAIVVVGRVRVYLGSILKK